MSGYPSFGTCPTSLTRCYILECPVSGCIVATGDLRPFPVAQRWIEPATVQAAATDEQRAAADVAWDGGHLRARTESTAGLVDELYNEITTPGAVPSFDADEVIAWTIRRLLAKGWKP